MLDKPEMRDTDIIITATNKASGRELHARLAGPRRAEIFDPETGADLGLITMDATGKLDLDLVVQPGRTPEDAGKCLMECASDCDGDFACAAGCAMMCATIII